MQAAGYRWYETANFCRTPGEADGRDLRAHHNLAYWEGRDYLGLGVRELEKMDEVTRLREHVMLGLRLDEPLALNGLDDAIDDDALRRLTGLGLVRHDERSIALTRRGRFLGGGVTADLLT